jgi:hypothetical protein
MGNVQQGQPVNGLVKVNGIDGAKAYQMPPNSVMPLFHSSEDILYIKVTDGAGFPEIREFSFTPIESKHESAADYVSRSEFEEFKASVLGKGGEKDGK